MDAPSCSPRGPPNSHNAAMSPAPSTAISGLELPVFPRKTTLGVCQMRVPEGMKLDTTPVPSCCVQTATPSPRASNPSAGALVRG